MRPPKQLFTLGKRLLPC